MKSIYSFLLGLLIAFACNPLASAQEAPSIPKVLQVMREYLKPGKAGMVHDKTESAFAAALTKAKYPAYYLGLNSLTGKSRGLYLTQFESFAEWEKANKIVEKNAALGAALERAGVTDGELLDEMDTGVFLYAPELSYHPHADVSHARFMEIAVFHVRAGKDEDWHKLAKMVVEGNEKAGTSAHWAAFGSFYGIEDGTYILLSSKASMAEIDTGLAEDKKFQAALGEDGMKSLNELFAATVDASRTELFSINPRQSYAREEWIKADPAFWKPKPAALAAKLVAEDKKVK